MKKILPAIFFLALISSRLSAQLTVGSVNPGPYAPGSSIAVTFSTGTSCVAIGNIFELYLSDANGNFASQQRIGTYSGFYSTFVNGTIPAGTPPGTGYKLRVRSTSLGTYSSPSAAIEIRAGSVATAALSSISKVSDNPLTFGTCNTDENTTSTQFLLKNESNTGNVTVTITNELTPGPPETMTFNSIEEAKFYTASLAHYTLFVKATMPDGSVGTQAYFLINNLAVTAFTTTSGNTVCYPTGSFEYRVEPSVKANFPGNTYKIDWGDKKSNEYTYCDIQSNGNRVNHLYTESSCGLSYTSGNQTFYNAFGVNVGVVSPFCGPIGAPLSTPARVVTRPVNKFVFPPIACVGDDITFVNQSLPGQKANTNSPGCAPSNVVYNWYIDDVLVASAKPLTYSLVHKFTVKGKYMIRLSSISDGGCPADDVSREICVQDPPKPAFVLSDQLICLSSPTISANSSSSILDQTCPNTPVYTWTISPATGVTFNKNAVNPNFTFAQIGIYNITLSIETGTCTVSTIPQKVVVNSVPQATLSQNTELCTNGTYTFGPNETVTKTTVSGTAEQLPDTYTWTVTGGGYTFVAPSTANSMYPVINFTDFAPYTITLTYKNNCGTVTKTQVITFSSAPVPTITANPSIICYNDKINLEGTITNRTAKTTFAWTGAGTFLPQDQLTTVYTPTAAERTAGLANIKLVVSTGIVGSCAQVEATAAVKIRPNNTVTNPPSTLSQIICSGDFAKFNPTAVDPTSTFTWTAANPDGFATGFSPSGNGNINEAITNTSTTQNAVVTYTITPAANGCTGVPFTFTVNVNPPTIPGSTATLTPLVCQNSNTGTITLSGNVGTVIRWENSADQGTNWTTIPGNNVSTTYTFKDLTATTWFRAVVQNGACTIKFSTSTVITVTPATTIANAGPDQTLCNQTTVLLKGNTPKNGESGKWTKVSGPGNITIVSPATAETEVQGLTNPGDYVFKWTITGNSPCGPTESSVTIRNNAPINQNISSTSTIVCNGQKVLISGSTPGGGEEGTYTYSWESKTGTGAWTIIAGETGKDLSLDLTTTGNVSFRRTVTSGGCTSVSNELTITVQPPITKNTIAADQTICSGLIPEGLKGSIPEGADGTGNFLYQWQSSLDGNTWTNINGALGQNYQPQSLTQTTYYRRLAGTLVCSGSLQNTSGAVKITVNPNAKAEFSWTADKGCIPFALPITAVAYADRNASYTWYADGKVIGTSVTFPGYTIANSNQSVTIKLVVTSKLGCSTDEFTHDFSTNQAVPASFTPVKSEGCDPLTVTFVNTSVLTAGATFTWDFGNGESSKLANPAPVTFHANPSGKDSLYTVTLTATTTCGANSVTATVFVKAKPLAVFSPSKTEGCSPMRVDLTNTSPGGTNKYYYDFGDGSPILEKDDKSSVNHVYNTTKTQTFVATLTAVNECGTDVKSYNIIVSPQNITPELVVDGKEKQGCAPWTVHFDNNSIGASRFTFVFGDGGTRNTVKTGTETYTFTKPGTYTVKMTAFNSCSEISTTETITVLPQPLTAFDADKVLGCAGLKVQFKNNTQDGFSYVWDFGDGSPTSNEVEPSHVYNGDQEYYTVTLTATNTLGCSMPITKNQFIHIVPPPVAKFNVAPSTLISIPNYTFRFEDESTNSPNIWQWDFGDKQSSSLQNPSHTYLDTGTYVVTLKVINQQGCFTTTFKKVTIVGVPGYLFIPNAFMPGSETPELREFRAKGSGIKSWRMNIFNKWGQMLWETTKLDEGRPAEGWNGIFQSSPVPQGVYFWKIDVQFINGTEWKGMTYDSSAPKRTGAIHLIR